MKKVAYQIISNYFLQKIPTVLVSIGNNRYIFNMPQTTTRFIKSQQNVTFPNQVYFFFTSSSPTAINGLTSFFINRKVRNNGNNKFKVYTQQNLFQYLQILTNRFNIHQNFFSYSSWNLTMQHVLNNIHRMGIYRTNEAAKFIKNNNCFENQQVQIIPIHIGYITHFIIKPKDIPGNIIQSRLAQFGISSKQMQVLRRQGKVQINGQTIFLQNLRPNEKIPTLIILHLTSQKQLKNILQNKIFINNLPKEGQKFEYIHIIEQKDVLNCNLFRQFINRNQNIHHTIANPFCKNQKDQLKQFFSIQDYLLQISKISEIYKFCLPNIASMHQSYFQKIFPQLINLQQLFLSNATVMHKNEIKVIGPLKFIGLFKTSPNKKITQNIQLKINSNLKSKLKNLKDSSDRFKYFDPIVHFLGTGSKICDKNRAVSCIFVQIDKQNSIILDCGEGSYFQMINQFGYDEIENKILSIKVIFITHMHLDHNLGILQLICQRKKIIQRRGIKCQPLFLIIPQNVLPWFHHFCINIQDLRSECQLIFIQTLIPNTAQPLYEEIDGIECTKYPKPFKHIQFAQKNKRFISFYIQKQSQSFKKFKIYLMSQGLTTFLPVHVLHCSQSFGVILEHQSGVKISYSGDTRPIKSFAQAAYKSSLLIHQSTYCQQYAQKAKNRFHSTVGQAIEIGLISQSWRTALTHFAPFQSFRQLQNFQFLKENNLKYQYAKNQVIFCCDHLKVKLSQSQNMAEFSRNINSLLYKTPNDKQIK